MMFKLKNLPLFALFFLPTLAPAAAYEIPAVQAKARQVSASAGFWPTLLQWLGQKPVASNLTVKVTDAAGRPLKGAAVMVGMKKGDPFEGNTAVSDEAGIALFSHEKIQPDAPFTITASRSGYSTLSLVDTRNNSVELALIPHRGERDFGFLSGKVNGFPPGRPSGELEVGLFLPAFRGESLLNFDPQQFVSSYKVDIDLFGKREVPGNVVMPPQRKWYGIVPISLSKPEFTMPLALGTKSYMGAVVGSVAISPAIDAIKQKDFMGALSLANFTHAGWTSRRVDVNGNENFDVTVNQEVTPKSVAAKLSGLKEKLDWVAISFFDVAGDGQDFIALDVKGMKSEEMKNGAGKIKLGLLKQKRSRDDFYVFVGLFDRQKIADKNATSRSIVGSLQKIDRASSEPTSQFSSFFRMMRAQNVSKDNREFEFTSPTNASAGLVPNFLLVNLVSEKKNEFTQGKTKNILWSAVLPGDSNNLKLPNLGKPVLPNPDTSKEETFSWEVIAVKATDAAQGADLDVQSALRGLQHVSTLSQKF